MRHLINKHYDTPGGLLGHPTNVSSHPKPPVSLKEDETMKYTVINTGTAPCPSDYMYEIHKYGCRDTKKAKYGLCHKWVFEGSTGNCDTDYYAEFRDANSEYASDNGESIEGMTDKEVNDKYGWEHKAHNCCKGGE